MGSSSGITVKSASRMISTSPRAARNPVHTFSALQIPGPSTSRMFFPGCNACMRRTSSAVPSVDLSSQKIISVYRPMKGMRSTAGWMFPASLRHGTITETETSSCSLAAPIGRATITCIRQSRRTPGRRAKKPFRNAETRGTHLGKSSSRCMRTIRKPASRRNPRMSFP